MTTTNSLEQMTDDQLKAVRAKIKDDLVCAKYIESLSQQRHEEGQLYARLHAVDNEMDRRATAGSAG